jgi:hypothetical protein
MPRVLTWMWVPVAAVVACVVFFSLDRLPTTRDLTPEPVIAVKKASKIFIPPPVVLAAPERMPFVPSAPPLLPPPAPVMPLWKVTAEGGGKTR